MCPGTHTFLKNLSVESYLWTSTLNNHIQKLENKKWLSNTSTRHTSYFTEYTESKDTVLKNIEAQLDSSDVDAGRAYESIYATFKKYYPHNSKKSAKNDIPGRLKVVKPFERFSDSD